MIAPNMATMLGFIATDAAISAGVLGFARRSNANSFNAITVDGDGSTNDSVLIGQRSGRAEPITAPTIRPSGFRTALDTVMRIWRSRLSATVRRDEIRDNHGDWPQAMMPHAGSAPSPSPHWSKRRSPARIQVGRVARLSARRAKSRPVTDRHIDGRVDRRRGRVDGYDGRSPRMAGKTLRSTFQLEVAPADPRVWTWTCSRLHLDQCRLSG